MRRLMVVGVIGLLATLAACGDGTGPGGRSETTLNFVRQQPLAPPLLASQGSFWAKVGAGREIRLYYQDESAPADTGDEFLRFEVPGDGLGARPDGSMLGPGDSILITVTVEDPERFAFSFAPAGLRFNPERPARLKVYYYHADHDFDGDGDEDEADAEIEGELDLWRQATAGASWFRIGAVKFEELDEISANILSFSKYAVAW